jgi:hypothetical protein
MTVACWHAPLSLRGLHDRVVSLLIGKLLCQALCLISSYSSSRNRTRMKFVYSSLLFHISTSAVKISFFLYLSHSLLLHNNHFMALLVPVCSSLWLRKLDDRRTWDNQLKPGFMWLLCTPGWVRVMAVPFQKNQRVQQENVLRVAHPLGIVRDEYKHACHFPGHDSQLLCTTWAASELEQASLLPLNYHTMAAIFEDQLKW